MSIQENKKRLWEIPWKFRESIIIALGLFIVGNIIQYFSNGIGLIIPKSPYNSILLGLCILLIYAVNKFYSGSITKWLASYYAAIAAIITYSMLVLLMGFIAQKPEVESQNLIHRLGYENIIQSWQFIIISFYLLIILSFTILKRLQNFKNLKNVAFFLNHAGLWIIIATASVGSVDISDCAIRVFRGKQSSVVLDKKNNLYQLPFSIELVDFTMENYPSEIILYKDSVGAVKNSKDVDIFQAKTGLAIKIEDWHVKVLKYLPNASPSADSFIVNDIAGAITAAFIEIRNNKWSKKDSTILTWIASGNDFHQSRSLYIGDDSYFILNPPKPKYYESKIKIHRQDSTIISGTISVNSPFRYNQWHIYQTGYDVTTGKYSEFSILQLVQDPWLYVVYLGIAMLLLGSTFLFWYGKLNK